MEDLYFRLIFAIDFKDLAKSYLHDHFPVWNHHLYLDSAWSNFVTLYHALNDSHYQSC